MRKSLIIGSLAATFVLAPAASAFAHTHVEVCDYEYYADGRITEIWFSSGKQLSNPQNSNDPGYSEAGYKVTNRPCPVGTAGADGKDGKDGKDGAPGAAGAAGAQGPKGDAGAPGADGKDGATGADGAAGSAGEAGPAGPVGPAGADGNDGADGLVGSDGSDGAVGAAGPAGSDGRDGKDGVTKTVIVEDGEKTEVPSLPATGAATDTLVIFAFLGLAAAGTGVTLYVRNNRK